MNLGLTRVKSVPRVSDRHFGHACGGCTPLVLGRAFWDTRRCRCATGAVVLVARAAGVADADRREGREGDCARSGLAADDLSYPGEMLAFIRKKFVGSYFALRPVSRVHWLSL
jgi:hypothetical protein